MILRLQKLFIMKTNHSKSTNRDSLIREIATLRTLITELQGKLNESSTIARFFKERTEYWENAYNEAMHKYWDILEENAGNKERLRCLLSFDQRKSSTAPKYLPFQSR